MARTMTHTRTPEEFWGLGQEDADGCILWSGKRNKAGYGRMGPTLTGEVYVHRSAWVLTHGAIPEGLTVEHTCHTDSDCAGGDDCTHRRCIHPGHLILLPQGENASRQKPTQKRKTHCPKGHPYSGVNLYLNPRTGRRHCRECMRVANRAARRKR